MSLEKLDIIVPCITNENGVNKSVCLEEGLLQSVSKSKVESEDTKIEGQNINISNIRRNKKINKLLCEICNKSYTLERLMDKHKRTQHPNVNLNSVVLKSEIISDKLEQDQTYIKISETGNTKVEQIEGHLLNKINEDMEISQDITETESLNTDEQKKNVKFRRKKVEVEDRFFCEKCTKGFTRKFDLRRHVISKHPDVEFDDSFSRKKNREILNKCKIIEDGKTFFECDICKHRTKQSYNLVRHRTIHSGVTPYVCHICGKRFRLDSALRKHIEQLHVGVKKYQCDICQKEFGLKSARDEHLNIHSGSRPFSCDICQKSFKQKSSMYIHKLYHTNNFKYSCQLCEKKFRRSQELVHHNRLHTGHKPFICDDCGARFRLGQDLKRHKIIHLRNNEKWGCEDCSATFSQERYLKLHRRIHS